MKNLYAANRTVEYSISLFLVCLLLADDFVVKLNVNDGEMALLEADVFEPSK